MEPCNDKAVNLSPLPQQPRKGEGNYCHSVPQPIVGAKYMPEQFALIHVITSLPWMIPEPNWLVRGHIPYLSHVVNGKQLVRLRRAPVDIRCAAYCSLHASP